MIENLITFLKIQINNKNVFWSRLPKTSIYDRAIFNWVPQNQSNYYGQRIQWANQNLKQIHVAGGKRGKTRANKSQLVLLLPLIGQ